MEKLYYNLSKEEFSKERKALLWIFAILFFIAGLYVVTASPVFGHKSIPPVLSMAPFGISLLVFLIAVMATIKRKDLYFLVDDDKIEFKYGFFKPLLKSFNWISIDEIIMAHQQRKIKLLLKDGSSFMIDLTYLQNHKSGIIRKHIYNGARDKDINVIKVKYLK